MNKQVYIFVERDVFNEYRTFAANKEAVVQWQSVDDKRIFEFLGEIYALRANNAVLPFDTSHDVIAMLREQWAGLFQRLLIEAASQPSFSLLKELRQSLDTSRKLAETLTMEHAEGNIIAQDILLTSHPIFGAMREKMRIPYRVFFTTKSELDTWLDARGFKPEEDWVAEDGYFEWENRTLGGGKRVGLVKVSKSLFENDGSLKSIRAGQWQADLVKYTVKDIAASTLDDDIPF